MTPSTIDLDAAVLAHFGPLRRAERVLVHALAMGEIAKVAMRRPEAPSGETSIRAPLLAFVLRHVPALPRRRLEIIGAYVEGRLDLGSTVIGGSLWFYRCSFDAPVMLDHARIGGGVTFAGCHLVSLMAEGCTVADDFAVNAGCRVERELRLSRARIGGTLDCARLNLGAEDGAGLRRALVADGAWIGGDVRFVDGFEAMGELRCVALAVDGDFVANGHVTGHLVQGGGRGPALTLDRATIGGALHLVGGFGAAGRVSLRRACVGADLDATGASFDRLGDAAWGQGPALVLDRATIDGALVLRQLQAPLVGASFVGARVSTLADDESTWGERLTLDGFAYSRFAEGAPLDTAFRIDWLERQDPAHLKAQFRIQPWRRLIRVLRRMGHDHHAGSVALRREHRLRRIGRIGAGLPPLVRWMPQAGHWLLGVLAGYGYRPGRLLGWLAGVWLVGAMAYWLLAPATGALAALGFSFARLVPFANLAPPGPAAAAGSGAAELVLWLARAQAGFGWAAAGLLVASLAGWADRDRPR